jgi:hypothetical protein
MVDATRSGKAGLTDIGAEVGMEPGSGWPQDEPATASPGETLEPRQRPGLCGTCRVLLVVVLALAGWQLLGTTDPAGDPRPATREQRLPGNDHGPARAGRSGFQADWFHSMIWDQHRRRQVAEDGFLAFLVTAAGEGRTVDAGTPTATTTVAGRRLVGWVRAHNAGDGSAEHHAEEVRLTFVRDGDRYLEASESAAGAVATLRTLLAGRLRVVGPVLQSGDFAAVAYRNATSAGVIAAHVTEGRIDRQWVVVENLGD